MLRPILCILFFFPICFLIDLFNGSDWLVNYKNFIVNWWDIIVVALLCKTVFTKNKYYKYEMLDELRVNQFLEEVRRYDRTPYISPLMLMYLKNPPGSNYPSDYEYVNDTFYRLVVNTFRDRIYVLKAADSFEPEKREPYLNVIGEKNIIKCLLYLVLPFAWMFFVYLELEQSMFFDWPLLTVPFMFAAYLRGIYCIEAFIKYNPRRLNKMIKETGCNLKVTWRDAFPDRTVGITFVRAYWLELERRQRCERVIKNLPVPTQYPEWDNPNFAPFPFPHEDKLPLWENEYEPYYEQLRLGNDVNKIATNPSNIVSFPKVK